MTVFDVVLQAKYDDAAQTVTISGMGVPPAPPDGYVQGAGWWGQTGPGFTFTVGVKAKNLTPNPTAIYIVPDSNPVERRLVEYVDGAWQMPGTVYEGT